MRNREIDGGGAPAAREISDVLEKREFRWDFGKAGHSRGTFTGQNHQRPTKEQNHQQEDARICHVIRLQDFREAETVPCALARIESSVARAGLRGLKQGAR